MPYVCKSSDSSKSCWGRKSWIRPTGLAISKTFRLSSTRLLRLKNKSSCPDSTVFYYQPLYHCVLCVPLSAWTAASVCCPGWSSSRTDSGTCLSASPWLEVVWPGCSSGQPSPAQTSSPSHWALPESRCAAPARFSKDAVCFMTQEQNSKQSHFEWILSVDL